MPTTIAIEFPWGRYHGTPWGRNVNEGVVDWPPEPWRLLRALYATWKARAPKLPEDVVASLLDALADPPEYIVPAHRVAHTRHYYPDAKHGLKGRGADTDKVFDTFAVMERGATLRVTWPAALAPPQRDALDVLCERLTYLGRADSICQAFVVGDGDVDQIPPGHHRVRPVEPGAQPPPGLAQTALAAQRPLQLADLEVRPQRMRRSGRREPPGSRRVLYPAAGETSIVRAAVARHSQVVTAVRLRITGAARPSPQAAVAVTHALRQAALKVFNPNGTNRESVQLFGKNRQGERQDTDHQHAHYLAFIADDAQQRLLDTLVVWAPGGLDPAEAEALVMVPELRPPGRTPDFQACRVAVEAMGSVEDVVPELCGPPSRRWRSFTPYAPPKNIKRQPTWQAHAERYLRRDLDRAGMPAPLRVLPHRDAWLSFRRHRPGERLEDARRAAGFVLELEHDVRGPISLGALRHFGLGLFVPDRR